MNWECKPCKVAIPVDDLDRIRRHLRTKKHQRLKHGCQACGSLRLKPIEGETWDRDGIRSAQKCGRCNAEFKSYASGLVEKERAEYTGEWPAYIKDQEAVEFHKEATARGYVKRE